MRDPAGIAGGVFVFPAQFKLLQFEKGVFCAGK
jgi:hypothetical protein